jgi:hypothetical protein
MVLPPWDAIPGDYGDARLIITLLEHSYSYIFLDWPNSFWSPSWQFYPYSNTLAMSETMAGAAPFYIPFRLLGLQPASAYQCWFIILCLFNFLSAYLLARELYGTALTALLVAFLFAFGMPRFAQFNHSQLLTHFLSIFSIWALIKFFRSNNRGYIYLYLAGLFAAWQFWSCVYLGLFLVLAIIGFAAAILFVPNVRNIFFTKLKSEWKHILGSGALTALILAPLAYRYNLIQSATGYREWHTVFTGMPRWKYLLLPIPSSFLYSDISNYLRHTLNFHARESYLFPGFLSLLAPFGLVFYLVRKRFKNFSAWSLLNQAQVFFLLGSFILLIATTRTSPKWLSLFYYFYEYIPGFGAIRQLTRIHLLFLLFWGLSIQFLLVELKNTSFQAYRYIGLIALAIVILENSPVDYYVFSKQKYQTELDALSSLVSKEATDRKCKAFFLASSFPHWVAETYAISAAFRSKVPTLNGYSGHTPPYWDFSPSKNVSKAELIRYLHVNGWNHWKKDDICLVHYRP